MSTIRSVSDFLHFDQTCGHGRPKRGGGGRVSRSRKISGGRPPRNDDILASFFLDTDENFAFSTIFKIKWPKSEEKLNFGGRWVWVPMNLSPPKKKNFVATPLLVRSIFCQVSTNVNGSRGSEAHSFFKQLIRFV